MKINHNFKRLTIISSAGCNLACKYCAIAQNKTSLSYANQMQKEIIKAFEDGSFLENTKKIYQFFGQDLSIVTEIDLWGQEPTLTLPYLGEHIKDWIIAYPNWNHMFFSTNMGTDPNLLFNFILNLDKALNKSFTLKIQISYDGIYSCINERGIDPQVIKDHYITLINLLNKTVFQNLNVIFSLHGVINFDTIYALINDDNLLLEYIIDLDQTEQLLMQSIQNIGCKYAGNSLIIEQPHDTSTQDGQILSIFLQKIQMLSYDLKLTFKNPADNLLQQLINRTHYSSNWENELNDQLNLNYNSFKKNAANYLTCGTLESELKITYNGILLNCLNNIFNTNQETLNSENQIEYSIFNSLLEHPYYINPLSATQKEIENLFNIYDNISSSFLALYQSTINLMILLADDGQIHSSYKYNKEKLIYHAYRIACFQYCVYNRLTQSSSHYLSYTGVCRLFCNGLLDLMDNYFLKQGEKKWTNSNQMNRKF